MNRRAELEQLRAMSLPELREELRAIHNRAFTDRVRIATRNLDTAEPLRQARKRVARIMTLIAEMERAEAAAGRNA
jgi:ribosomal protein L29